jgi:ATP-binding cassette subfamily F protein uup
LLDEPANDLDITTLSALEEFLLAWSGAVVVVSHDRGLLDRVATSLLVFEGDGKVVRYAGNYSDYRSQRAAAPLRAETTDAKKSAPSPPPPAQPTTSVRPLTYAERIELDGLMDAISRAEADAAAVEAELADPSFYATHADRAAARVDDLSRAKAEVSRLIARWEELEMRREQTRGRSG